jgi:hypothetical protein
LPPSSLSDWSTSSGPPEASEPSLSLAAVPRHLVIFDPKVATSPEDDTTAEWYQPHATLATS